MVIAIPQQQINKFLCYCFAIFLGGAFPFTLGRIEHGFNVRPDLCAVDNSIGPRKYLGQFYTDSLVHDPRALQLLVDVIGMVGNYDL